VVPPPRPELLFFPCHYVQERRPVEDLASLEEILQWPVPPIPPGVFVPLPFVRFMAKRSVGSAFPPGF